MMDAVTFVIEEKADS